MAPPRRSEQEHRAATMMTHDEDLKPTMKKSHAQVAKGQAKESKRQNTEEMIALQQSHNVNSLNGDNLDYSVCEAQMLADAMCDFNETFKTEENFANSWQQSIDTGKEDKEEFSNKTNKLFNDKTKHEQHAQQHMLEKGLKMFGKKAKMQHQRNRTTT